MPKCVMQTLTDKQRTKLTWFFFLWQTELTASLALVFDKYGTISNRSTGGTVHVVHLYLPVDAAYNGLVMGIGTPGRKDMIATESC